jgi:hypothetical protein
MLSTEFSTPLRHMGRQAMVLRDDQRLSFPRLLMLVMIVGVTLSLVGAAVGTVAIKMFLGG